MPAVTLNSVAFSGSIFSDESTVRWAPTKVEPQPRKVGELVEGPDGQRTWVHRAAKTDYLLTWDQPCPTYTRDQVKAIFALTSTFTAVLPDATLTVQCEEEDFSASHAFTLPNGNTYWTVTLLLRQP
jgi:hypothetical protein